MLKKVHLCRWRASGSLTAGLSFTGKDEKEGRKRKNLNSGADISWDEKRRHKNRKMKVLVIAALAFMASAVMGGEVRKKLCCNIRDVFECGNISFCNQCTKCH